MKISRVTSAFLFGLLALTSSFTSWAEEGVLSEDEIHHLYFMREEEKLARDVYLVFYKEWGMDVFANIALSEQRHTDAIRDLIEGYSLEDPVVDDSIGVFVDEELAELYEALIERGLESAEEALYVGALIEEVDMEDIQHAIDESDETKILTVYDNLMRASKNHLRGFVSVILNLELTDYYEAQHIDQEWVDEILSDEVERGETH
ncbi:MAG: DUF2202 domain-containing protein [Pseudomonadota bacterium]|nr:DUF2202 domain-containing protein [Pseudomonadota bacterium]